MAIAMPLAIGLLLMVPAAASAASATATAPASHETMEAVRWGLLVGFGAEAVLVLLFTAMKVPVLEVVIGKDGRVSTSKTIAVVWTFVVAAALLALVYAEILDHPEALNATNASGVVGQYALLFGGTLGSAILAKAIVTGHVNKDPTVKPSAESTSAADLVANDAGETDLGDLQYVLFNAVALVFVIGTMLHAPANGLPHIPDVLLGLTSVSAAGYVGKKMLPSEPLSANLSASRGKAEGKVTISLSGLPVIAKPQAGFWVRFGSNDEGKLVNAAIAGGIAAVDVEVPRLEPPPGKPVSVTVVPESGTVVPAGDFEYQP